MPYKTTQREKIVECVSQMIKSLGVKSVRMDDVAANLGMSKRTLYEMFGDKEELLYESLVYMMIQRQQTLTEQVAKCDNMLEVLLMSVRLLGHGSQSTDMDKRLATNLKKFYPNVYDRVKRMHAEQGMAGLQYALDKCREEGYLDPYVDVELMVHLFFSTSGVLLTDDNIVIPEGVSREEAFGAMTVNFLRGLSTEKGLKVIDEILAREPRPKKLSERREIKNN